jgi:transposase InsO family protein
MKTAKPGELVQIDHMEVIVGNKPFKHFSAICPVTKILVEQVFSRATSTAAAEFLDTVRARLPFPLLSVQVDGGSEFMGNFESSCAKLGIPLYVLPPRRPQYNGTVERSNSTVRSEFYLFYTGPSNVTSITPKLLAYEHFYNTFRPHQSLQNMTPQQYYQSLRPQSHM